MDPKELLYPRTKFEVLRTLYFANDPVPLREIAYRSDLVVGSVQTALKALCSEEIITCKNFEGRTFYILENHQIRDVVAKLLTILEPVQLRSQPESIQSRALNLLPQLEERRNIITRARRSLNS